MFLSRFLAFLFGPKQSTVDKNDLIGSWLCEKQNGIPIKNRGFNSIKLTFTNDLVEIIVDMNEFGGQVIAQSKSHWQLHKDTIKTKFGEHEQKCIVTLNNKRITFKPDLFFRPESILISEYKKIE